jgi:hypothetical protein
VGGTRVRLVSGQMSTRRRATVHQRLS